MNNARRPGSSISPEKFRAAFDGIEGHIEGLRANRASALRQMLPHMEAFVAALGPNPRAEAWLHRQTVEIAPEVLYDRLETGLASDHVALSRAAEAIAAAQRPQV